MTTVCLKCGLLTKVWRCDLAALGAVEALATVTSLAVGGRLLVWTSVLCVVWSVVVGGVFLVGLSFSGS